MDSQDLAEQFCSRMLLLCQEASSVVHFPVRLLQMIQQDGGVGAAKRVIQGMTDTFVKLWEADRLDLTVEAVVLEPQWAELFTSTELDVARQRLRDAGYLQ